jgi:hypothetical protein
MKKIILVFAIYCLVSSCNYKKLNDDFAPTAELKYDVSIDQAITAASNVHKSELLNKSLLKKQQGRIQSKTVKNSITIPNSKNPSYFIVNYEEGGWSIISSDKRIEPIMAFSETGEINRDAQLPQGLLVWLMMSHEKMKKLKTSRNQVSTARIASVIDCPVEMAWAQVLDQAVSSTCGSCQDQYSYVSVGPLLTSSWNQGCGFNNLAPYCNNPSYCNKAPVGCVPLAMSQVMYYWKKPGSYNWSSMSPTTGSAETSRLTYDAGNGIPNFSFGCDGSSLSCGSSANCDGGVTNQFKTKFGYSSANFGGYDYNILRSNLSLLQPVMLGAYRDQNCFLWWCWPIYSGHSWVCDGYSKSTYYDCNTGTGYESNMLHMNWGWGSYYNAWVKENDWAVNVDFGDGGGIKNFNYFRDMYYNIKP